MNESDAQAAVRVAREILDGSTPLLWGCRRKSCGRSNAWALPEWSRSPRSSPSNQRQITCRSTRTNGRCESSGGPVKKEEEIAGFTEWARESAWLRVGRSYGKFGE